MGKDGFIERLEQAVEDMSQSNYAQTLLRDRPYDGQPWTDLGERGKQEIKGITMRDLRDCYIRACYLSSGLSTEQYPKSVYELPWDDMSPIAIAQNLTCEVERVMGIFPNLPACVKNLSTKTLLQEHVPFVELGEEDEDQ